MDLLNLILTTVTINLESKLDATSLSFAQTLDLTYWGKSSLKLNKRKVLSLIVLMVDGVSHWSKDELDSSHLSLK